MKKSLKIYTFKVALKYDKRTWRRIEIAANQTLDDLHEAIYKAFDRDDEHLYTFYFSDKPTSKSSSRLDAAMRYKHPYCFEDRYSDEDSNNHNAAKTRLESLNLKPTQQFEYLFDFGDCWWHEITFEGVGESNGGIYPQITEKRGDSPPQYVYEDEEDEVEEEKVIEVVRISTGKEPVREKVTIKKSIPAKEQSAKKVQSDDTQPDLFDWITKY